MNFRGRFWAGLVLLGVPVGLLWPLYFTYGLGSMEDDLIQYFPGLVWLGRQFAAGVFPLWNGLVYGGYPAIGDPQSGVFYPPNWIAGLVGGEVGYPVLLVMHYWVAGIGMYRLGRAWKVGRVAALAGGLVWMFSGFLLGHRTHYTILASGAWLSVIVFLWTRIRISDRPQRLFVAAVVCQAMQILAGHVQVSMFSAILVLGYLAVTKPVRIRTLVGFGFGYVLTFGLAAVQLFPVWQTFAQSVRSANGFWFSTENSFYPLAWPLVFAPASLGVRVTNFLYPYSYYGPWHLCEMLFYTTLAGLVPAGFAVRNAGRDPDRRRLVWFWVAVAVVSIFLALGRYNPAYKYLYALPILRPFRCPARFLIWFDFSAAALAMIGIHALANRVSQVRFRRFATVFTAALLGLFILYVGTMYVLAGPSGLGDRLPASMSHLPTLVRAAVDPFNPGLFIPVLIGILLIVLCGTMPARFLPGSIVVLLLVELGAFVPFYDVSLKNLGRVNLRPPVVKSLDAIAPDRAGFLWPVSRDPYVKPLATLEPFTNLLEDRATITGYGPLLNVYHRRLFGWELWPAAPRFLELLTRPDLLNRYGIRFIPADETIAQRIRELKTFQAEATAPLKQFIVSSAALDQGRPYTHRLRLSPGLYRLGFSARTTAPGPVRLFISASGLGGPLWSDQQLALNDWDLASTDRRFQWTFFVPPPTGPEVGIHFSAGPGEVEVKNLWIESVGFRLDYLKEHSVAGVGGGGLFENTGWPGRAYFVGDVKAIEGLEPMGELRMRSINRLLFGPDRGRTYLAGPERIELPTRPGLGQVREFQPMGNELRIRVQVQSNPAVLVIPGGYDPGWRAYLDRTQAPLFCADGISRAVLVPPGEHEVRLSYLPDSLIGGGAVTIFSALALLIVFARGGKDK